MLDSTQQQASQDRADRERNILMAQNNGYGMDYCHSPPDVACMPCAKLAFDDDELMKSCQKTLDRSRVSSEKAKTFREKIMMNAKTGSDSDSDETTTIGGEDEVSIVTQADRAQRETRVC